MTTETEAAIAEHMIARDWGQRLPARFTAAYTAARGAGGGLVEVTVALHTALAACSITTTGDVAHLAETITATIQTREVQAARLRWRWRGATDHPQTPATGTDATPVKIGRIVPGTHRAVAPPPPQTPRASR